MSFEPQEMQLDMFTTVEQARDWLQAAAAEKEGAVCPCCDRFDKIYTRKLNLTSIQALFNLYRLSKRGGRDFYHYRDFVAKFRHGDFPKLEWVNLLMRAPNTDKKKKTSGMYSITDDGERFCEGELSIPKALVLYHNELIGVSPERGGIRDFWPNFDYAALMGE